jgi:hypothetical protein
MVLTAPGGWGAKKRCLIHTDRAVHMLFRPEYFSLHFQMEFCLLHFLWSKSVN